MASYCDGIKLKVTGFDKTEEEIRETGFLVPEISFENCSEVYYPQTMFSWSEETVEMKHSKTTTVFITNYYSLLTALMPNLERILVDGRGAPYEGHFTGHYLHEYTPTTSYIIKEIDNETGNVLYEQIVDTIPNIVHDICEYEEEHAGEVKYISDKEELLLLMETNKMIYEFADQSLKEDEELAFMSVEKCGNNFKYILDKFKEQRRFQLAAFISSPMVIHQLPKETQEDFNFLLEAIKSNEHCIRYIEDQTLRNKIREHFGLPIEGKRTFGGFSF